MENYAEDIFSISNKKAVLLIHLLKSPSNYASTRNLLYLAFFYSITHYFFASLQIKTIQENAKT